jgi:hypothetical protein
LMRTNTGFSRRRPSNVGRFARASALAPGATPSSRSTITATDRRALFTAEVAEGTLVRPGEALRLALDPPGCTSSIATAARRSGRARLRPPRPSAACRGARQAARRFGRRRPPSRC